MNVQANSKKVNSKQLLIIIGLLLLAGAYHFTRPTLERVLNMQLPSLSQADNNKDRGDSSSGDFKYDAKLPGQNQKSNSAKDSAAGDAGTAVRNWLTSTGDNRYRSPAGLVYTPSRSEHRIEHVLLHCKDNPSKPAHGIFLEKGVEVFKLIDEAYELAKAKSSRVQADRSQGKNTYVVEMNRKVGFDGGAKGKRNGGRELKRVKLVLADDRVITAFPTR